MGKLIQDLRYGWRMFIRHRAVSAIAVVTLALGIGANTAVFSLLKNLMLSPLPVRDPRGLHLVVLSTSRGPSRVLSYAMFEKLRDNFPIFSDLLGWSGGPRAVVAGERSENASVCFVTGSYFESLGIRPAMGRLITE
jgi:hypothetical protein